MKEFFTSFYFIAPFCISAIILGIFIIRKATKILIRERLSQRQSKGVGHIYDILSTEFSSFKVLKDALFIPSATSILFRKFVKTGHHPAPAGQCVLQRRHVVGIIQCHRSQRIRKYYGIPQPEHHDRLLCRNTERVYCKTAPVLRGIF